MAGRASVDGGLMIDLSLMKGIHVEPKRRSVRAQGGVTWGQFNRETQFYGLATTGGVVSTTGIAGYTLGGGLGWLMGKLGLAIDNLLSAEVVTADGRVLVASERERPDLFWGIRGGGGNFGIVTSFQFRLHPIGPIVTAGQVAHPFSRATDVLQLYRDVTASAPDELNAYAALATAPDGTKLAAIGACDCGGSGKSKAGIRRIKAFGSPVMDALEPMTYCKLNSMEDELYPKGALNYWKACFLPDLSDEAIGTMIDCYARCPSPMGLLSLEHLHGAVARVGMGETAFPFRSRSYNFLVLSQWTNPADTDRCIAWARDSYKAMQPLAAPGRYVNYMSDNEEGDPVSAAYGRLYLRLQRLKAKYDPENFFHINQNIEPLRR